MRSTIFSDDRIYRYSLWRSWQPLFAEPGKVDVAFICLNPSTADETQDDPTVRRCVDFAKRWGFSSFCMLNLFAFRATDPSDMRAAVEPVGSLNDCYISDTAIEADMIVCAWGKHGSYIGRDRKVLAMLRDIRDDVYALRLNKDGSPEHPLYMPRNVEPIKL